MAETLLALVLLVAGAPLPRQDAAQELREAEARLAAALVAKDTAAFDRLLAEDFRLRGAPDVDRATWIRNARELCWGDRYELADVAVARQEAATAIVTLVLTTFADPSTCEPALIRSAITDIWTRTADGWRLTLRHSAPAGAGVDVQFSRTAPPPPRWERAAELSLVATGGNTDTQTLGAAGSLFWRPGPWTTAVRTAYVRSVADDVATAESFTAELRQSRTISARMEAFARASHLVDRFAGIRFRTAADAGLGWILLEDARGSMKVDAGAGVTHESRRAGENLTFATGTASGLFTRRLSRTATVRDEALVTLDLGDPANWRLRNALDVTVTMTRVLSLKVSHELKRLNRPVAGFRPTDTVLSAALVAAF